MDDTEALLLTGLFGTGKSSVASEMAETLEARGVLYAAIDLDWLCWGYAGEGPGAEHRMLLANVVPVVVNYRSAGVTRFILARSMRTRDEVDGLREAIGMPLRVVRLTAPWDEIERRLRSDVTSGRQQDLREAAAWRDANDDEGAEDRVVANDRPIGEVAQEILVWLGW